MWMPGARGMPTIRETRTISFSALCSGFRALASALRLAASTSSAGPRLRPELGALGQGLAFPKNGPAQVTTMSPPLASDCAFGGLGGG